MNGKLSHRSESDPGSPGAKEPRFVELDADTEDEQEDDIVGRGTPESPNVSRGRSTRSHSNPQQQRRRTRSMTGSPAAKQAKRQDDIKRDPALKQRHQRTGWK